MNDRVWRIKMQTARALWRAAYTDKRGCLKNRKSVSGYERENGQKKKKKRTSESIPWLQAREADDKRRVRIFA